MIPAFFVRHSDLYNDFKPLLGAVLGIKKPQSCPWGFKN